jgi:hypothetical protein
MLKCVAVQMAGFQNIIFLGDDVTFIALDLTLSVADIYARVNNEAMRDYLPPNRVPPYDHKTTYYRYLRNRD